MTQNAENGSPADRDRKAVSAISIASLPVMTSTETDVSAVEVHADVLALVEASQKLGRRLPWSTLVAIAATVAADSALSGLAGLHGRRVARTAREAVTDLIDLGLLTASTDGFDVTEAGAQRARAWNGGFSVRLEAALAALPEDA